MRYRAAAPVRPRADLPLVDADGVIRLRVPASVDHRDLTLRVVAAACRFVGFSGPGIASRAAPIAFEDEVTGACGAAFDRVLDGGNTHVELEIEVGSDAITVRLHDHGGGFDVRHIVQSSMDEVSYYRSDDVNVLSMTKKLR